MRKDENRILVMQTLEKLSAQLGTLLEQKQHIMTTAESCTGGGVAAAITDIAGSSAWFDRAFITYSNEAKMEMLGVSEHLLNTVGAVSEPVVIEMVQGALKHSRATLGVSISGIAGPGGGSDEKPVGTVCFAWASTNGWHKVETVRFSGDRGQVREQASYHALSEIYQYLSR